MLPSVETLTIILVLTVLFIPVVGFIFTVRKVRRQRVLKSEITTLLTKIETLNGVVKDEVKDVAKDVAKDLAKDLASEVKDKAKDLASKVSSG